jgi:hypothetical protein
MRNRWAVIGLAALSLHLPLLTGCFTLAKQAYAEARGAQADVLIIAGVPDVQLARIAHLQFTPATTTVGSRICPPPVLRAYDRCIQQIEPRLKTLYPGESPALVIASEIAYFQGKGLLGGALMLTRVRMTAGNELVLDALVRAESDSFRAGGESDLANASAQALYRLLDRPKRGAAPE